MNETFTQLQEKSIKLSYYVVGIIDILGQKEELQGWAKLPAKGSQNVQVDASIKKTIGSVLSFEKAFRKYFDSVGQCTMPDVYSCLTDNERAAYHRLKDCSVSSQQFSDTFVFYSQLPNNHGDVAVAPVFRMLGACIMAMHISLTTRQAIRGGLCIGAGTEISPGNFYGPALAEAHHLESKVADYPRIVVSNSIKQYLAEGQWYSDDSQINMAMRELAAPCRELLNTDIDGQLVVDFFGEGARKLIQPGPEMIEIVSTAFKFIADETERFNRIGNVKLRDRYKRLNQYMESRRAYWNKYS